MKVSEMQLDALDQIASEFLGKPGDLPSYRRTIHKRDGELAATDGRVLIHVWHPQIRAVDGANEKVLDFQRPKTAFVAGADWIRGPLDELVAPAMRALRERLPGIQEDFAKKAEYGMSRRTCPCCGQTFWEDDDGDFHDPEEYIEENRPDEYSVGGNVMLSFPDSAFLSVALANLGKALRAAKLLGGATALRYDGHNILELDGDGFYIVLATAYRCVGAAEISIQVPPVPAEKGGAE